MKAELKVKIFDIPDIIICKECGKKLRVINTNHLRKHGLTSSLYKKKYPDEYLICKDSLLEYSNATKNYFLNHPKMAKKAGQRLNNNITYEDRIKASKLEIARYHQRLCSKIYFETEEGKETRKKMSNGHKGKKHSKKTIQKITKSNKKTFEKKINMTEDELFNKMKKLKRKGLSNRMIAKALGITNTTVNNWLKNKKPLTYG